jgi:hypothetical protein
MKHYKKYRVHQLAKLDKLRKAKIAAIHARQWEEAVSFRESEKIALASLGIKSQKRSKYKKYRHQGLLLAKYHSGYLKNYNKDIYEKMRVLLNNIPPIGWVVNAESFEWTSK